MMDITTLSEIIRLTDAVYESDKMNPEQDYQSFVDSFKEVKDELNPKRYVRFVCNNPHSKWQSALDSWLQKIGDGKAVKVLQVTMKDGKPVFGGTGFTSVAIIDMSKIDNIAEDNALRTVIRNTVKKMSVAKLEKELADKTQELADKNWELGQKTKQIAEGSIKRGQFEKSLKEIKDAADKAKAGPGSRKVNALKEIIEKAAENVK